MLFRFLSLCFLGAMINLSVAKAQQIVEGAPVKAPNGDDALSSFQAINASIDTVLMQYEQLTGKDLSLCPSCGKGRLIQVERLAALQMDGPYLHDTS